MAQFKVYICSWYRGPAEDDARQETIEMNSKMADQYGYDIGDKFPSILPYVPHTSLDMVRLNYLWSIKQVDTTTILKYCQEKVKECDMLIAIGHRSKGMDVEIECALANGVLVVHIENWEDEDKYEKISNGLWVLKGMPNPEVEMEE